MNTIRRFLLVLVLLSGSICLSSAWGNSSVFKFGVKGGMDFISFSKYSPGLISESMSSYTGFVAGAAFSVDMPVQGMTLQPELNYVSKGARFKIEDHNIGLRTDYIELPVNLQVGLDLILLRPFLAVSPYIGYAVYKGDSRISWDSINRFEYGVGVGGGIDFWHLQLQIKYNWNFGHHARIPETSAESPSQMMDNVLKELQGGNYRGLEVSLVFFF